MQNSVYYFQFDPPIIEDPVDLVTPQPDEFVRVSQVRAGDQLDTFHHVRKVPGSNKKLKKDNIKCFLPEVEHIVAFLWSRQEIHFDRSEADIKVMLCPSDVNSKLELYLFMLLFCIFICVLIRETVFFSYFSRRTGHIDFQSR